MPKLPNSKVSSLVAIVLLVLAIPIAVYITQRPQKYDSKAEGEQVDQLTKQLYNLEEPKPKSGIVALADRYIGPSPDKIEKDKLATAIVRHDKLVKLAENDPDEFLKHADLYTERDKFTGEVKDLLEKPVNVQGKVEVIHYDDFTNRQVHYRYRIKNNDQEVELLTQQSSPNPTLIPGSEVSVQSIGIDDKIVYSSNATSSLDVLSIPPTSEQRAIKAAAILYKFQNTQKANPYTKQQVEDLLINKSDSVKNYFLENSYNKMLFSAVVFDWVTLPINEEDSCSEDKWDEMARQQLAAQGVDLSGYTNLLYISLADTNTCGVAHANLDAEDTHYPNTPLETWVFGHELGHNLGLEHANSLICNDKSVDTFKYCTSNEYGDLYDNMGYGYGSSFNAPHKEALGWFNPGQVEEVTQSGDYTIHPITSGNDSPLALKIAKPDTGETYYIEYHQPVGIDKALDSRGDGLFSGISIRLVRNPAAHTFLLDSSPLGEFEDSSFRYKWGLEDNGTFYDDANGIQITQVAHSADEVTLKVTIGQSQPENTSIKSWDKSDTEFTGLRDKYKANLFKAFGGKLYTYVSDALTFESGDKPLTGKIMMSDAAAAGIAALTFAGNLPTDVARIRTINFTDGYVYLEAAKSEDDYYYRRIFMAPLNSDGTFGTWGEISSFNTYISDGSFIRDNKYYFVDEQYNPDLGYTEMTLYASGIARDGTLSQWSAISTFPRDDNGYVDFLPFGNRLYAFTWGDRTKVYYGNFNSAGGIDNWNQTESAPEISEGVRTFIFAKNKIFQISGYQRIEVASADVRQDGTLSAWSYTKPIDREMSIDVASDDNALYISGEHFYTKHINEFYVGQVGTELNPIQTPAPTPSPRISPVPSYSPEPSASPLPQGLTFTCSGEDWFISTEHVDLSINITVSGSGATLNGGYVNWFVLKDNQTGTRAIIAVGGDALSAQYHDIVGSVRYKFPEYDQINLTGDGGTYTLEVYNAPYTEEFPVFDQSIYSVTSNPVWCPSASPSASPTASPTESPTASPSATPTPQPTTSPEPTQSPVISPSPTPKKIGDVNNDGAVNILDYGLVIEFYDQSGSNLPGDANHDGTVNILDFGLVIEFYDR